MANETAEQRRLRNDRIRRYRDRRTLRQAVGRFLITEDLITALIASGDVTPGEAMTREGIDQGVARVLDRFTREHAGY